MTTSMINNRIQEDPAAFVIESEAEFNAKIDCAAEEITGNGGEERPLILISGPSGSGKTTTAIKLFTAIKKRGIPVCYLSMDKFFKTFTEEQRLLKQQNKIDLESPERVDAALLNRELKTLIEGGAIEVPTYDFLTNTRKGSGKRLSRNGGFVIVEGIHALNPEVLGNTDAYSHRLYVSVRTRVTASDGERLHPCKLRLMRRMLRDNLFRHRSAEDTIVMFPSVQRGENRYILPFKNRAEIHIDTFIPYEPAFYRQCFYEQLSQLAPKYADVRDIVKAMKELMPISDHFIPEDALLREFIGGSSLSY